MPFKILYSSLGYNFSKVQPKVRKIDERSVDLVFQIERGDVTKQEIDVRIKKAESELDYASKFDNIIINNDLEESKKIALTLIKEFIDE